MVFPTTVYQMSFPAWKCRCRVSWASGCLVLLWSLEVRGVGGALVHQYTSAPGVRCTVAPLHQCTSAHHHQVIAIFRLHYIHQSVPSNYQSYTLYTVYSVYTSPAVLLLIPLYCCTWFAHYHHQNKQNLVKSTANICLGLKLAFSSNLTSFFFCF